MRLGKVLRKTVPKLKSKAVRKATGRVSRKRIARKSK